MAEPVAAAKKKASPQPNRFMLSFGTKYASIHTTILKDAAADDRDPGEYMVRWLAGHYVTSV